MMKPCSFTLTPTILLPSKSSWGPINVISGNTVEKDYKVISGRKERKEGQSQDYVVAPPQKWVDGIATGSGQVKQFVATATTIGFASSLSSAARKSNIGPGIQLKLSLRDPSYRVALNL